MAPKEIEVIIEILPTKKQQQKNKQKTKNKNKKIHRILSKLQRRAITNAFHIIQKISREHYPTRSMKPQLC